MGGCLLLYNKGLKDGYFTIIFFNKGQKSVKHLTSGARLSQNNAFFSTPYINKDLSPSVYTRAGLFYICKFLHIKYRLCKWPTFVYKRILNIKNGAYGFAFWGARLHHSTSYLNREILTYFWSWVFPKWPILAPLRF